MKTAVSFCLLFLLGCNSAFGYTDIGNNTFQTDGSRNDVAAAIAAASDGYTIQIPPGSFTWTAGIVIAGKGIHLRGSGAGRIIARSATVATVGTGSKTFATQSGLGLIPGQSLTITRTGGVHASGRPTGAQAVMAGTVASYSGTTLVMNITSVTGSGTHPVWMISTDSITTITHSAGASTLISATEDATHNVRISGIRFLEGSGTGPDMNWDRVSGGKPILMHDCWFTTGSEGDVKIRSNRGVIWNTSFNSRTFSSAALAIQIKAESIGSSWSTPSTMGAADVDGTANFYVEDCDFHAYLNAVDNDDNGRSTFRHCVFDNAGFGTHGADTSNYGQRHFEVYDSTFVFNGFNDGNTMNLNWWFFIRGGTAVITDNVMPDLSSTDYGNKGEINMIVINLQRHAGPNPCWGANQAGNQYPAPRQVGMGYVTGSAGNDSITYRGDSEPLYFWNNTGGYSPGTSDYGSGECPNADSTANYVVAGRDYFNDGRAKPGYTKFTYPHPLARPGTPQGLRISFP